MTTDDSLVAGRQSITADEVQVTDRARPLGRTRLNLLACGVMLALALVFMSGGLLPGRVAAPMEQLLVFQPWQVNYPQVTSRLAGGDIILQQLPWHEWIQHELAAGRFPLWASGPLGGYPLFAHYQPGVLNPLHLLWALLPTGVGFGIIMMLKLWLAGVGMWFFLGALGLRPAASFLAALGFMFSAGMVVWLPWANSALYLLLPWLAWAAYAWCAQKSKGALGWLALLTAFSILAGHPETLFLVGTTIAVWTVSLVLSSPRRDWARQLAGLAIAAAVGLAIGAIQLLPFFEALGLSHSSAVRQSEGGIAFSHLDAGSILNWILPRTWGQQADGVLGGKDNITESIAYVGPAALIGVVLAIVALWRRRLAWRLILPWAALAIFGWLAAYDMTVGLAIRNLPVFNQNVNGRWILIVAFALLVIGAYGWDDGGRRWTDDGRRTTDDEARTTTNNEQTLIADDGRRSSVARRPPSTVAVGIVLIAQGVAILAAHLIGWIPYPDLGPAAGPWHIAANSYQFYWAIWEIGVALGVVGAVLLWTSGWRVGRVMPLVAGAFLVGDLWMLMITYNPTAPSEYYYPKTSFISQLNVVSTAERLIVEGQNLPSNTGLVYGFQDWRAQDLMFSERAYKASRFLDPTYTSDLYNRYNMFLPAPKLYVAPALGMRYFILPRDHNPNHPEKEDPGHPDFRRLAFKDELGLWEAQGVPGFVYLTDYVWTVSGEPGAALWMQNLTWEKMRSYAAVVESPGNPLNSLAPGASRGQAGNVTVTEYTPGHIRLDVDAARPSLLVVAESYYPGWRASIDEQPVEILRANYLSQGIVVPQGKHSVELKYEPGSFRYGAIISLAGLAGLAGLWAWAVWRKRRGRA